MIRPEASSGGERQQYSLVNEDRYWRVRANLQRFMEFADVRIEGAEVFSELAASQPEQGAIIAPTHTSWLDVIAVGVANSERPMRFLGKQELWKLPYIGGLARDLGAFSVDRTDESSRRSALDTSTQLVEQGEWVVMYPEGTRNKSKDRRSTGDIKSTGVARVSMQASGATPIIPVGVGYREGFVRRKASPLHLGVVIGEPIFVEQANASDDEVRTLMAHVGEGLAKLKSLAVDLAES